MLEGVGLGLELRRHELENQLCHMILSKRLDFIEPQVPSSVIWDNNLCLAYSTVTKGSGEEQILTESLSVLCALHTTTGN